MAANEPGRQLHRKLEEILGASEAGTLMDELGSPRLETELLRKDL